jgi:hypothetical protein
MGINSSKRKLTLSGWLLDHSRPEFDRSLKLQKFLFFYEALSKLEGDDFEFAGLKGYVNGPVFSAVWGDYTKERMDFVDASSREYVLNHSLVNARRAKTAAFIVTVFTETELSEITHAMNIWASKKDRIGKEDNVELFESDFNESDAAFLDGLAKAFPSDLTEQSEVVSVGEKNFVFPSTDAANLLPEHFDVLAQLSDEDGLNNPVYASFDDEGALVIDC